MNKEISNLIFKLSDPQLIEADIISWGSPILSFGNYEKSKIATLGINPSNKEFVDNQNNELKANKRRFHTLTSLNINSWSEINDDHISIIKNSFNEYFNINPYDNWFKKLDYLISGSSYSYYFPSGEACHLDLVPFATNSKWSELSSEQKKCLLNIGANFLGKIIENSEIEIIILNGQTVIDNLIKISNVNLHKEIQDDWRLNRKLSNGVKGFSYSGSLNKIGNIKLKKVIKIYGFNHNIQSSFGVTKKVQSSIRSWLSKEISKHFYEL